MVVLVVGLPDHGLFLHRDHHDQIFVQPSFHHQQLVLGLPSLVEPSFLLPKSKMNYNISERLYYLSSTTAAPTHWSSSSDFTNPASVCQILKYQPLLPIYIRLMNL